MSFMRINDNLHTRKHFEILQRGIEERLIDCTHLFSFYDKRFNFRTDSTQLNISLYDALSALDMELKKRHGEKAVMWVTSLYRKPFSLLTDDYGKTYVDYNDLTVPAQLSHWGGFSIDFAFGQFERTSGLKREVLKDLLTVFGFTAPFRSSNPIKDEPWHYSFAKRNEWYSE